MDNNGQQPPPAFMGQYGQQAVPNASQMTPEQLQQWMELSGMDEQGQDLDAQLAQAQALRQPQSPHTSGWGAALGGIGDIINTANSGMQSKDIQGKKKTLLQQKLDARKSYAQQLAETLRGPQAPQAPPPITPLASISPTDPSNLGPVQDPRYGYGYIPGGG